MSEEKEVNKPIVGLPLSEDYQEMGLKYDPSQTPPQKKDKKKGKQVMADFDATLDLDGQGKPIYRGSLPFRTQKLVTFAGATSDGIGDESGSGNPNTIFTVTGVVKLKLLAVCKAALVAGAGAPTYKVGISGSTALFIASTTASLLIAGEIWHDATPDAKTELESVLVERLLSDGQDIIGTVANSNDINTGGIDLYALWAPLSDNGLILPA